MISQFGLAGTVPANNNDFDGTVLNLYISYLCTICGPERQELGNFQKLKIGFFKQIQPEAPSQQVTACINEVSTNKALSRIQIVCKYILLSWSQNITTIRFGEKLEIINVFHLFVNTISHTLCLFDNI